MSTATEVSGQPIDADIPCANCGYDLRGLAPSGRCPECGGAIEQSVYFHDLRQLSRTESLTLANPKWVQSLAEGAMLSVLVSFIFLAMLVAPDWAYARKTTPRAVMLGFACSAWVIAWFATWKLTQAETGEFAPLRMGQYRRIILRTAASAYLLLPFLMEPMRRADYSVALPTASVLLFSGFAASIFYYLLVGGLIARAGQRYALFAHFTALLGAFLFGVMALEPSLDFDPSSLSRLMFLPTVQAGAAILIVKLLPAVLREGVPTFAHVAALSIFCQIVVNLWVCVVPCRVASKARANARKLATNFVP